jgi:hypothetical protein
MPSSALKTLQLSALAALTLAAAACSSDQTPRADSPNDAATTPSVPSGSGPAISNRGRGN